MNEANTQGRLRLYLIRHGEVEGAVSGKLLGRTDAPLSERGLEQSRQLAKNLSAAQISAIYSRRCTRKRGDWSPNSSTIRLHSNIRAANRLRLLPREYNARWTSC